MQEKAKKVSQKIAGVLLVIIIITFLMPSGTMSVQAASNEEQTSTDRTVASMGQTPSGIAYADLEEQIAQYIDVRKETTSSVSMTYFNEQENITSVIYGDANAQEEIAADENTVYEWGSISKILVWTSVMQLYEQGKLELDIDVREYLPKGFLSNLSYDEPVTMLHLMNHTAGFQETTWDVEVTDRKDIVSLEEALKNTAPPQIYEPGTVCSYSNWGAALAAYIVECISEMDYADYVHQNIFEPLDMKQTFIRPDGSDNAWVESQRQQTNAYYNVQGLYEDYGACRRYILLYPAGSATGTMRDLVRFAQAFLTDSEDCPLFTEPDTLALMLSPTLTYSGTDTPRICHGLFWQEYGVSLIGHAGNTTGFTANLVLDVAGKRGLVVMTNEVGETTYNYGLVSLIFGDCQAENGFVYEDLSGIYCNSRANYSKSFMKLYSMISGLFPVTNGDTENSYVVPMVGDLTQISENVCIMDDGNGMRTYLGIQRDEDGNIIALQHMTGMDFQKTNLVLFVLKIVFFLLFVLLSVWNVIMLLVHTITLHRFGRTELWNKKVWQLVAELFVVLASIMVYWLLLPTLLGEGSLVKMEVMWKAILIILFTTAELVMLLLGIFRGISAKARKPKIGQKEADHSPARMEEESDHIPAQSEKESDHIPAQTVKKEKSLRRNIGFIMTYISGILLVANVLYWHFYQFWGC